MNILLALKASDKQCFKDEEVDKLRVEERAKDGEEIPMRAITMMKRNTNDNEEVYQ